MYSFFFFLKVCAKIKEIAEKAKVEVEKIEKAVKEAIAKDIAAIHEIIEWIKAHMPHHLEEGKTNE